MDKQKLDEINNYERLEMMQYLEDCCESGDFEAVKYILTSPNIKNPLNIYIDGNAAFIQACENGHLDIVKYLTSSTELSNHVLYSDEMDKAFNLACYNEHLDIIKYLIFDFRIEYSDNMHEYLKDMFISYDIKEMFELRELNDDINKELNKNDENKLIKKVKI